MTYPPAYQEKLDHIRSLQRLFAAKRIPVSGSINLTNRCNLNCIHCYLGDRDSEIRCAPKELETKQWLNIIDQITEAGCLNLLLSGGEVLLRPDFEVIYEKAVTNGLLTAVFTNGTILDDHIISLFRDLPPQVVEITLYGASQKTYEAITGVKGSYKKCLQGIEKLHKGQIRFKLKTMILAQNFHELDKIEGVAQNYGVGFRLDSAVSPCLDSNRSPLQCRVSPEDAVKADFANPARAKYWTNYYKDRINRAIDKETLYNCGAGLTNFHIDPAGTLLPCMMLSNPAFELTNGSFSDGWRKEISKLRSIKASHNYKCNQCDKKILCSCCPAVSELENNSPEIHSNYLCEISEFRQKAIDEHLSLEG